MKRINPRSLLTTTFYVNLVLKYHSLNLIGFLLCMFEENLSLRIILFPKPECTNKRECGREYREQ